MTDAEFATYLSAWEVARNARDQAPTSANIARARSARDAYLSALDIQRGDARELTVVDWAPGVPQEAREASTLPDVATFYRFAAPPPEDRPGFRDLLKRLGLLDWSGPGPRIRVQVFPPVVAPLYRVDFGDDVDQDQEARESFRRARQSPDADTFRHPELVRGEFVDDEAPEGPNPDDMVPGPDVPRWFYT